MWFTRDFFDLDGNGNWEIPKDILNLINSQPYVKKISEIRRRFVVRGAKEVFTVWRRDTRLNHAYTYNKGARNELQANIGIWHKGIKDDEHRSIGIRLGYGFNFSGGRFGEPLKVSEFLDIMLGLLRNNNSVTSKIWNNLSPLYWVEYVKENYELKKTNKNFEQLFDWLKTEDVIWLFFGRFIGIKPKEDIPSILDEKNSLVFINEFFEKTLDFYGEVLGKYYSQS